MRTDNQGLRRVRGSALLTVIILSGVFGAMCVAFVAAANVSLRRSQLHRDHVRARAVAETGLNMAREVLPSVDVSKTTTSAEVLAAVAAALNTKYQATAFNGNAAVVQDDRVVVPQVTLSFPEGPASIEVTFVRQSDTTFLLESRGHFSDSTKRVAIQFRAAEDTRILTTYGVASRSRIKMLGNGRVVGKNETMEGSILSTTYVNLDAIDMIGHVYVSGNVAVANPMGSVSMKGNTTVGGEIMIGVEPPAFPELDVSPLVPYATNIISQQNVKFENGTMENIRIKAGTNPTFNGSTVLRGVVYVESPNTVNFSGNLTLTGVIITEDTGAALNLASNVVRFGGNVTSYGVETLPDLPQFAGLRDKKGSFALLPGFSMVFTGSFDTLQGSLAASKFDFGGNCTGTIRGTVINYHDTDFEISGDTQLTIDHAGATTTPVGMKFPRRLFSVEGSYEE